MSSTIFASTNILRPVVFAASSARALQQEARDWGGQGSITNSPIPNGNSFSGGGAGEGEAGYGVNGSAYSTLDPNTHLPGPINGNLGASEGGGAFGGIVGMSDLHSLSR